MKFEIFLIFFGFFNVLCGKLKNHFSLISKCKLSDAYCKKDSRNVDVRLKSDLLCEYENEVKPTINSTSIDISYLLMNFVYVSFYSISH